MFETLSTNEKKKGAFWGALLLTSGWAIAMLITPEYPRVALVARGIGIVGLFAFAILMARRATEDRSPSGH